MAAEGLEDWLKRAGVVLKDLQRSATTFEEKLKVVEAAGKLAERFGKYTGLEKVDPLKAFQPAPITIDFGGMSLEERQALLDSLEE